MEAAEEGVVLRTQKEKRKKKSRDEEMVRERRKSLVGFTMKLLCLSMALGALMAFHREREVRDCYREEEEHVLL